MKEKEIQALMYLGSIGNCLLASHTRTYSITDLAMQKVLLCHEHCSTLYHSIPTFDDPRKRSLLKSWWEKEKMLVTSIFSFAHNVFYPFHEEFPFLTPNFFCRLQMLTIWTSLKICRLVKS